MRQFIYIITTIFLTVAFVSCNDHEKKTAFQKAHSNHKGTDKIVNAIEAGNRIESSHIGIAGAPSSQWDLYEQLKKMATTEELTDLTDHKNAVVRCYAFQALASKHSKNVFSILLKHLKDTGLVETQSGCIGMSERAGDYFLHVVTPDYIEPDVYKLTESERRIVDSILVNDKDILRFAK